MMSQQIEDISKEIIIFKELNRNSGLKITITETKKITGIQQQVQEEEEKIRKNKNQQQKEKWNIYKYMQINITF